MFSPFFTSLSPPNTIPLGTLYLVDLASWLMLLDSSPFSLFSYFQANFFKFVPVNTLHTNKRFYESIIGKI